MLRRSIEAGNIKQSWRSSLPRETHTRYALSGMLAIVGQPRAACSQTLRGIA